MLRIAGNSPLAGQAHCARRHLALVWCLHNSRPLDIGPAPHKPAEEKIDLLVYNPVVETPRIPERMVWTTPDLAGIARAVVGIFGWHTERSISRFEKAPELVTFAADGLTKVAAQRLGGAADLVRIVCLPQIPETGDARTKTLKALKGLGIHGVLSFRTILRELIARADCSKNYEKSDVLQIIRILKNYDFIKDSQMELFNRKARPRRTRAAPEPAPAPVEP